VLVAAGLALRLNGYPDTPSATANADEWAWAWGGLTLLTRGVPTGWSYLHAYTGYDVIHLHGTGYPLVTPWLDHPPLFAVLVGAFQLLFGEHTLAASTTAAIRLPAVLLGAVSVGLTQLVGRRVVGPGAALTGAALLAVAPAPVLLSREVESEALLAPLLLLAILLVHRIWTGEGRTGTIVALGAVAAAASLTKVPGVAVGGAAALALLAGRRWQGAAAAAAGAVAGLGIYALYGAHYDWSVLLAVINAQSGRRSGIMAAYEFIAAPAGINSRLRDGWWLLGWLAVAALASRRPSPTSWRTWPWLTNASSRGTAGITSPSTRSSTWPPAGSAGAR
jgi:4-amino-4-deoxy-L-arabinose transferase-like glycosyltransferase